MLERRRRRWLLPAVVCLVLCAGSFAGGFWYGLHSAATAFKVSGAFITGMWGLKADVAYRSAKPAEAEAILLDHSRMLADPTIQEFNAFGRETLASDRLLTFGRLARLAEGRDDPTAREQYLREAKGACSDAGYKECNEEFVFTYVDRLGPVGE